MSEAVSPTALAIVMTGGDALPGNDALERAIHARLPQAKLPQVTDAQGDGSLLFLHDGYMCAIGKIAAPCPISGDEPCVKFAWHWPEAASEIKKHKSHLLVSVTGGADAKRRAGLHGQLVAAAIEAAKDPIAVHWANADSLWPAKPVAGYIASSDFLPVIPFCVSVNVGREKRPSALFAFTKGLAAFGAMEIETHNYGGDLQSLNGFLLGFAEYALENAAAIKDGDTMGVDVATKITIRIEAASLTQGKNVYRLYFPQPGSA